MKIKSTVYCILYFLFTLPTFAQYDTTKSETKTTISFVPRVGIGMSRHFITEVGFAIYECTYVDIKDRDINMGARSCYFSFETMTPYSKPLVFGYKLGIDYLIAGHVTGAMGLELAYYQKGELNSLAIIPKLGFPLVNGSLSYGFTLFIDPVMRYEIGRHRVTLTYTFDRKSYKSLDYFIKKHRAQ